MLFTLVLMISCAKIYAKYTQKMQHFETVVEWNGWSDEETACS